MAAKEQCHIAQLVASMHHIWTASGETYVTPFYAYFPRLQRDSDLANRLRHNDFDDDTGLLHGSVAVCSRGPAGRCGHD